MGKIIAFIDKLQKSEEKEPFWLGPESPRPPSHFPVIPEALEFGQSYAECSQSQTLIVNEALTGKVLVLIKQNKGPCM